MTGRSTGKGFTGEDKRVYLFKVGISDKRKRGDERYARETRKS